MTKYREHSIKGLNSKYAAIVPAMSGIRYVHSLPLRIGISSCLLGNKVRYDGGHRYNACITRALGEYFELVPCCPEVAIGLGVPRPPIQLVRLDGEIRVRGVQDPNQDVTEALTEYGQRLTSELTGLSGFLFKQDSPSCGLENINVYHHEGDLLTERSTGVFARSIIQALPELPVEDEARLMDRHPRENFIERVFAYHQMLCNRN